MTRISPDAIRLSPTDGSWSIQEWPRSHTRLKCPNLIRFEKTDLYLYSRVYPEQPNCPFGISVKAKGEFPEDGLQFKVKFTIGSGSLIAKAEREMRLFPTVPSDKAYFPAITMGKVPGFWERQSRRLTVKYEIRALPGALPVAVTPKPPADAPSPRGRRKTYAGLANQGATCYMNSVLQSLFHLTKFRDVVYQMPTQDVEDKVNSIPLNLQALFYNMQEKRGICSTCDLTASFGWDEGEAFVQHDVQEFLRVLLSKIEEKMSATGRKDAIAEIFRGRFRRSIRNSSRKFEESSIEDFYDISLQVRGLRDLRASLTKFVATERLSGENMYYAGADKGRIPVDMGIKILELPAVLQLHLKRFEYDLARFSLVKLDDDFAFPRELDMSPYLDRTSTEQHTRYQLYAVLVHSGTSFGGHYYVYLRPRGRSQWFQFNDSLVEETDEDRAISENYGGPQRSPGRPLAASYTSGAPTYSTPKIYSAYMLFYVREDKATDIFSEDRLTPPGDHVKAYAEDRLQGAVPKKPEQRPALRAYSQECLHKNCQTATLGLTAANSSFPLAVAPDTTFEQLYEVAARELKCAVKTIRLWRFGITTPLEGPILASRTGGVGQFSEKRIFIQRKPAEEELALRTGQIIVFVKCYTGNSGAPLIFLGSCLVNSGDPIKKIVPKFIEKADCTAYREDPASATMPIRELSMNQAWAAQGCVNGTVIVLQPQKVLPEDRIKHAPEAEAMAEEEISDLDETLKIHTYFSFMVNKIPPTFREYYRLRAHTIDLWLVTYETRSSQCVLRVPVDVKVEELQKFVAIVPLAEGELAFDEKKDELLLFQNREKEQVPDVEPITYLRTGSGFPYLYFLVAAKTPARKRAQTIIVDLSRTGYRFSERRCFYVDLQLEFQRVKETMEELAGASISPMRILTVRSGAISKIVSGPGDLRSFAAREESLRFEPIPHDQVGVRESELVKVTRCKVNKSRYFRTLDFPFFLNIARSSTIDDVKEQIKQALEESEEMMTHYRFAILRHPIGATTRFDESKLLKKGDRVGSVIDRTRETLAWILPADCSSIVGARSEAVRIKN
jgi:ubiquitin C-terminal hydrolase